MAKVTPSTIAGAYASTTELNANFALIAAEFENCVSLDGTSPSAMTADFDLNNQDLLNGGTVTATSIILNGTMLTSTGTAAAADSAAISHTGDTGGLTTVKDALDDDYLRNDVDGILTGDLDVTGNFTSLGLKDVATGARWQVTDTQTYLGTLNNAYALAHIDNDQYLYISGGTSASIGANIRLSGSTHATTAKDMAFRSDFGTWMNWDYSADMLTVTGDLTVTSTITVDSIVQPKIKIIEIVDWDMDFYTLKIVPHGLTWANIRNVDVMIRDDALTQSYKLAARNDDTTNVEAQIFIIDTSNIQLSRTAGGLFDSTNFDSIGGFVRGWITITYV